MFSTILIQLVANKSGILATITPLAVVLLHALARWYKRAANIDNDALPIDLKYLAANMNGDGDAVQVPGGLWLGENVDARDDDVRVLRVRSIRTFIDKDSIIEASIWRRATKRADFSASICALVCCHVERRILDFQQESKTISKLF